MNDKVKNFWVKKWNVVLFMFLFFLSLFFVYEIAQRSSERNEFKKYDQISFSEQWEYVFSNGVTGKTELPANLKADHTEELILTNIVPELDSQVSFFFRSRHTNVKIYLDEELVYDSKAGEKETAIDTIFPLAGAVWNEVPLDKEDSGKEIKLVTNCFVQRYLNTPGEVFLGDRGTFFMDVLVDKAGTIIGAVLLILVSIILFVLWAILTYTTHARYNECLCLAFFTFTIALWEFTETRCLQFLFPETKAPTVLAFEMLALAPASIALYFTYGKREITVKLARIASVIPLVVWIFNNALHFLKIADLSETLILTQVMIAGVTIFLGVIQVMDLVLDKRANGKGAGGVFWWVPSIGFFLLSPILLVEVIKYITNATLKYNDDAILTTSGIIFYIVSLAIHSGLKLASENFVVTEASKAKTNFLANTSHDIRTPLNAIMGFNELILRDAEDEKTLEYAKSIRNAGTSLLDIINNILDLSKIESGKMELIEEPYSTVQLLDNVTSMVGALAEKKGLYMKLDIDEKLPQVLIGDQVRLRQVLVNILNNAVKYTKQGGITLMAHVAEEREKENVCIIYFCVKDTGIGIKPEDRERLFQKFERLDFEQNRNVEGTGLGMSIVVKLLDAMGSHIEVKSEYGKGSEFYFMIKQKIADSTIVGAYQEGKIARNREECRKDHFVAPDAKILIVDDVRLNLQVAKGLLDVMEMQIDTAESGKEAIELSVKNRYDVILMDHMMPGMDGVETVKKIRELSKELGDPYYKDVPIIALTANAISGMREKLLAEGMQDFISKPVEGKRLEETLTRWLPKEKLQKRGEVKKKVIENAVEQKIDDAEQEDDWDIQIEGMDVKEAKRFSLSKEMYLETLRMYYDSISDVKDKIQMYLDEKDIKSYTTTVHGLKSSSKIIGAMELSAEAKCMEDYGNKEDIDAITEKTGHLLETFQKVENILADFLKVDEPQQVDEISDASLIERLEALKEAALKFNIGALMEWEKENENVSVSKDYKAQWNKVKGAVRRVAYSECITAAEALLLQLKEK